MILVLKNIELIKGSFPKKILYFFSITLYLLLSAGIVAISYTTDLPLKSIAENQQLKTQWDHVSKLAVLNDLATGTDNSSIAGKSSKLDQDLWSTYAAISQKKGVYLIHADYFSPGWLASMQQDGPYHDLPEQPFWKLTFSPNFAQKNGIQLAPKELAAAESGTRLFLIPDTLSARAQNKLTAFLKEDSVLGLSADDVPTVFTKKREFRFVRYHFDKKFFTWVDSAKQESFTRQPVIYIATPENMTYIETGGIRATGLDGYLKFSSLKKAHQTMTSQLLAQHHLQDNKPAFLSVQKYIDGLQKDLRQTIRLFGSLFMVTLVLLILCLLVIATIFQTANQEKLAVKKFLGFSFFQLYRTPLLGIIFIHLLQLAVILVLKSKIGVVLVLISLLLQLILFWFYTNRNNFNEITTLFKRG
ncbi:hypothetical protein LFYK43_02810 [Ligilactobacillus salitolerans]|uniref:Uncharacterized protein n=1 Tax=Ligilactobacillus salitolerans TaxID=1808352 RepID=A0A401IQL3_9LACO|nr:hypothetical protein LFYK43_02810 [Ligilactobacillus salitolerans]